MLIFAAALVALPVVEAHAQYRSSAGSHMSGSFGAGFFPGNTGGRSVDVIDVSLGGRISADLGCAGLDYDALMNFEFDLGDVIDQMQENIETTVGNYLLTTIYSSPAVAAIFDSLEAIKNARIPQMQAKCDMGQIRKDAVNMCIERCGGDEGCQRRCMTIDDPSSNPLTEALEDKLNSVGFNGSIHEIVSRVVNICSTGRPEDCFITAMLPNVKYCGGREEGDYEEDCTNQITKPEVGAPQIADSLKMASALNYMQTMRSMARSSMRSQEVLQAASRFQFSETLQNAWDWIESQPEYNTPPPSLTTDQQIGYIDQAYRDLGCREGTYITMQTHAAVFEQYVESELGWPPAAYTPPAPSDLSTVEIGDTDGENMLEDVIDLVLGCYSFQRQRWKLLHMLEIAEAVKPVELQEIISAIGVELSYNVAQYMLKVMNDIAIEVATLTKEGANNDEDGEHGYAPEVQEMLALAQEYITQQKKVLEQEKEAYEKQRQIVREVSQRKEEKDKRRDSFGRGQTGN